MRPQPRIAPRRWHSVFAIIRIKRLVDELKIRRRRLDTFRNSPEFPGKARAQAREEAQYDACLVVAAEMLELPVPDEKPSPGCPLPAELRALLEDRLAAAGLDVFAPRRAEWGDVAGEHDPIF